MPMSARAAPVIAAVVAFSALAGADEVPLLRRDGITLTARDAGIRYGQALGASRACYGLRATETARALKRAYEGPDADTFRREADRTASAWQEALSCKKSGGPNECRLIFEMSCRDAYLEIGPEGRELPGLIERASAGP